MNPIKWILIGIVRFYQLFISPILGPRCRFYPTCSSYTIDAIQQHGVICGTWLAIKRIVRCHPANPGGIDPVPSCGCQKGCKSQLELENEAETETAKETKKPTSAKE